MPVYRHESSSYVYNNKDDYAGQNNNNFNNNSSSNNNNINLNNNNNGNIGNGHNGQQQTHPHGRRSGKETSRTDEDDTFGIHTRSGTAINGKNGLRSGKETSRTDQDEDDTYIHTHTHTYTRSGTPNGANSARWTKEQDKSGVYARAVTAKSDIFNSNNHGRDVLAGKNHASGAFSRENDIMDVGVHAHRANSAVSNRSRGVMTTAGERDREREKERERGHDSSHTNVNNNNNNNNNNGVLLQPFDRLKSGRLSTAGQMNDSSRILSSYGQNGGNNDVLGKFDRLNSGSYNGFNGRNGLAGVYEDDNEGEDGEKEKLKRVNEQLQMENEILRHQVCVCVCVYVIEESE